MKARSGARAGARGLEDDFGDGYGDGDGEVGATATTRLGATARAAHGVGAA